MTRGRKLERNLERYIVRLCDIRSGLCKDETTFALLQACVLCGFVFTAMCMSSSPAGGTNHFFYRDHFQYFLPSLVLPVPTYLQARYHLPSDRTSTSGMFLNCCWCWEMQNTWGGGALSALFCIHRQPWLLASVAVNDSGESNAVCTVKTTSLCWPWIPHGIIRNQAHGLLALGWIHSQYVMPLKKHRTIKISWQFPRIPDEDYEFVGSTDFVPCLQREHVVRDNVK